VKSSSVTALALSYDATLLLSGSRDGTLIIWDIASKQTIKNYSHYKGIFLYIYMFNFSFQAFIFLKIVLIILNILIIIGPITNLFTFIKPLDFGSSTRNLSNKTILPIQSFQRNIIQRSSIGQRDDFECVNIILNDNTKVYFKIIL
jgi:hypothetical protein